MISEKATSEWTTVSIEPETLNALRDALYERYGKIRGHVGEEANQALLNHIRQLKTTSGAN